MTDRPRVLVVEDTPLNRDLLEQLLEDDYDLGFAMDGDEALDMLETERFDLVLLDISIPKVDGFEVARRVRLNPRLKELPLIAVTAHAMRGDRERILAAGCDEHIVKPIDEEILFSTIKQQLARTAQDP